MLRLSNLLPLCTGIGAFCYCRIYIWLICCSLMNITILKIFLKKDLSCLSLIWDLGYCYRSWTCQISKLVPKFQEWSSCCNYLDGAENWKSTWTLYRLSTKSAVICLSMQETLTCKLRWKLAAEQGFQSQVTHGCLARGILKLCYHVSQKYWAKVGCSWEKCLNTE